MSDNTRHKSSRRGIVERPIPASSISPVITTPVSSLRPQEKEIIIVEDVEDDNDSCSPSVSLLCENPIEMFPYNTSECDDIPVTTTSNNADASVSPSSSDLPLPSDAVTDSDSDFPSLDLDLENMTGEELLTHLNSLTERLSGFFQVE